MRILRPVDYIVIFVAVLTIGVVSHMVYSSGTSGGIARIQANDTTWLYSLNRDRVIVPLQQDGTCEITTDSETVGVTASECPQQICISMGRISRSSQWIACLPHGVFIDVVGASLDPYVDAYAF